MSEEKPKEYTNGEITVFWKPDVCIHSANCVKGSPEVFRPKERPWIQIENASSEEIMKTVETCPSGALSYRIDDENLKKSSDEKTVEVVKIRASKNGPFLVNGEIEILDSEGNPCEANGKTIALCRCGASENKPFCDGSHTSVSFEG